jgi:hypothetical protein
VSGAAAPTPADATGGVDTHDLRPTKNTATASDQNTISRNGNRPLSAAGGRWWNGERWIPTRTADGLWSWDGTRWNATIDFTGKRLEELAGVLTGLAEDRYAEAGYILAACAAEWCPEAHLQQLVEQVQTFASSPQNGLLPRLIDRVARRDHGEKKRQLARDEHRALAARLAREVHRQTIEDADEIVSVAGLIEKRADLLEASLTELAEARSEKRRGVAALEKGLAEAEDVRLRAVAEARSTLLRAEHSRARIVAQARRRLDAIRKPGRGELKAALGPLRLHAALLETPSGRLPSAGLTCVAGTAAALWRKHRGPLGDLLLIQSPESDAFVSALIERRSELFLLFLTRSRALLQPCPANRRQAVKRFVAAVTEHSREAFAAMEGRQQAANRAHDELEALRRDRSEIQAAETELASVEADPDLLKSIDLLRGRLEQARIDNERIRRAQTQVLELYRQTVTPPAPLAVAALSSPAVDLATLAPPLRSAAPARVTDWGWLPALSLTGAVGLFLLALADNRARETDGSATVLFWGGLLLLFLPIAFRSVSAAANRRERLGLVVILGLGLYIASHLRNPVQFTGADNLAHLRSTEDILRTHHLFAANALLPISPLYPGLESCVAAIVALTGLPVFVSALLTIGVARLLVMLALFLFFESVSDSHRVAGTASVVYMMNPNFLFFDSDFSYESLAIAFGALALYLVARFSRPKNTDAVAGATVILLTLMALVVTHHVTSYALTLFLVLWALVALFKLRHSEVRGRGLASALVPAAAALVALVASAFWLLSVATPTLGYLVPHLLGATDQLINQISGRAPPRQLFRAQTGELPPLWERMTAVGSVALVLLALPLALFAVWRRYRRCTVCVALALASAVYPVSLVLRLTALGAEASSRAAEFVFVAIGLLLAMVVLEWLPLAMRRLRDGAVFVAGAFLAWVSVIFVGGVILGDPVWARLPGPYLVAADARSVEPQSMSTALWMRDELGPGHRITTDRFNRSLIAAYGAQDPVTSYNSPVGTLPVFLEPHFDGTVLNSLQQGRIRYVIIDRRLTTALPLVGYYYEQGEPNTFAYQSPIDLAALEKFRAARRVSLVYDSGDLQVYDVGSLTGAN